MDDGAEGVGAIEVVHETAMDTTGVALAVVVAIVAAGLLYWHIQQVKQRPATSYDKLVGGLWAAMIVLAVGRAISLML